MQCALCSFHCAVCTVQCAVCDPIKVDHKLAVVTMEKGEQRVAGGEKQWTGCIWRRPAPAAADAAAAMLLMLSLCTAECHSCFSWTLPKSRSVSSHLCSTAKVYIALVAIAAPLLLLLLSLCNTVCHSLCTALHYQHKRRTQSSNMLAQNNN